MGGPSLAPLNRLLKKSHSPLSGTVSANCFSPETKHRLVRLGAPSEFFSSLLDDFASGLLVHYTSLGTALSLWIQPDAEF